MLALAAVAIPPLPNYIAVAPIRHMLGIVSLTSGNGDMTLSIGCLTNRRSHGFNRLVAAR